MKNEIKLLIPKQEKIVGVTIQIIGFILIIVGFINFFANFVTEWIILLGVSVWLVGTLLLTELKAETALTIKRVDWRKIREGRE